MTDSVTLVDIKKRKGKITLHEGLFDVMSVSDAASIFSIFFPYYINRNTHNQTIEYYGFSEYFRELKEGEGIPEYVLTIDSVSGVAMVER